MVLLESKKYLIDTNILIYAVNTDSEYHTQAKKLLNDISKKPFKACLSTQNILEFKRILTHETFKRLIKIEDINKIIEIWLGFLDVIYEDSTAWLEYKKLENDLKPTGNQIFDMWLSATAIANGVDIILTANTKDFQKIKGLTAINPLS